MPDRKPPADGIAPWIRLGGERLSLLVTCEHGGNQVPRRYRPRFATATSKRTLDSHRGWDPGALAVARRLARDLGAPLLFSTVSRLVVDLNRSEHHPRLISEAMKALSRPEREHLLAAYYHPHRSAVRAAIAEMSRRRPVLHLAVHSFTPILDGRERSVELGLLYDPARPLERRLCSGWKQALAGLVAPARVRLNQPYRGTSDGLTTAMRATFAPERYLGVEIELNQTELRASGGVRRWARWIALGLAQADHAGDGAS